MKHAHFILLPVLLLPLLAAAQLQPVELPNYHYIKYKSNHLHYDTNAAPLMRFFERWRRLANTGQGTLNIVHIGGSHVQAGTFPNTIRYNLMAAQPRIVGGRGMIFPYSAAARCNNPTDYRVHCVEKMILTRNVYHDHTFPLGVCGIAVTASDTATEVQMVLTDTRVDYATNRIVLLGHSNQGIVPRLRVGQRDIFPSYIDAATDRFVFNLSQTTDSFAILLPCTPGDTFSITGVELGNRRPGITYHSIGVNGAAVPDYLRCSHFVRDLRLLHPDLVVFGIGINDAAAADFDTAIFRTSYLQLIDSVRAVNPDCAFIFLTNNDSYRKTGRRRYKVNANGPLARDVFYRLARDTQGAVWDQFEVMGGLKSMEHWQKDHLAQTDKVHFANAGYQLIGNLFTNALFEAYNGYVKRQTAAAQSNKNNANDDRYRYISY